LSSTGHREPPPRGALLVRDRILEIDSQATLAHDFPRDRRADPPTECLTPRLPQGHRDVGRTVPLPSGSNRSLHHTKGYCHFGSLASGVHIV